MVSYKILIRRSAAKELRALPTAARKSIITRIRRLATQPRPVGVEKLKGFQKIYRFRSGLYRVVYEVDDDIVTVTVIKVGHRKDVYRR